MKDNLTEIIFILDRSGSMGGLESDTIGGYNSFIDKQRESEGEALLTTILFDDKYEILHNGVNVKTVAPITKNEYFVRGSTALLDAVGKTINDVGVRLSNTPENERPSKVIMVITTDGMENASKEFTYPKINSMIKHQREKYNWEFIFLGANIDAVKEAENLGIPAMRAAKYTASSAGSKIMYETMAENVVLYRKAGKIKDDWDKNIKDENKENNKA